MSDTPHPEEYGHWDVADIRRLLKQRDAAHARIAELEGALLLVTKDMDNAGGDRDGMPECPWCHAQDTDHANDCELVRARRALERSSAATPPDAQ